MFYDLLNGCNFITNREFQVGIRVALNDHGELRADAD